MSVEFGNLGQGIKRARKERGIKTQEDFVKKLEEFGYPTTIATVRNWEQGKTYPEAGTLEVLCRFFGCDMDYLFMRIDSKTHDVKHTSELTGLSVESVNKLVEWKSNRFHMLIINYLIERTNIIDKLVRYYKCTIREHIANSKYDFSLTDQPPLLTHGDVDYRVFYADVLESIAQERERFSESLENLTQDILDSFAEAFLQEVAPPHRIIERFNADRMQPAANSELVKSIFNDEWEKYKEKLCKAGMEDIDGTD